MANRNTVTLSEEQVDELREAFNSLDKDNNAYLSMTELGDALKMCGIMMPGYQLRELMSKLDTSGDGKISLEEFKQVYAKEKSVRDIGCSFIKAVATRTDINILGGTSNASVEGTTHTVKHGETDAFSDWINNKLRDDADCSKMLPVDKDGSSLFEACKNGIILCKLINKSVPGTIDERTINKTNLSIYRRHENLTLVISSASGIGCNIVNIGAEDIESGRPHLVLGLMWQIIRIGLLSEINLAAHPGLIHLLEEGETLEDLQKLSPEAILLRWVNYHLRNAGCPTRINNFTDDIKDSEAYTYLLHQIAPKDKGVNLQPLQEGDRNKRAELMLQNANKIDCRSFVAPADVVEGNYKLNLAFVANLFNNYPALEGVSDDMELDIQEETREEKTYRNWMNSMGVAPYVHYIYNDLTDGLIFFQLFDIVKPGSVNWNKVNQKFKAFQAKMKKIENCNYVIELGNNCKFSLVGIGGEDIHNGVATLTLAVVWQLMKAYTMSILNKLSETDKPLVDKDIIDWAKQRLEGSAHFESFKDPALSDGIVIIKLIEKLKPSAVDWNVIHMKPESEEEKLANARYAIGMSRKIGAFVYALPEDIVEVKPKMVLTIFACLMARDLSHHRGKDATS